MVPTTPKNVLFCPYSPTRPLSKLWKNQVNLHWLVSPTHAARFPGLHIKSSGHLFSFYKSRDLQLSCTASQTISYIMHKKRRQTVLLFTTFHHFSCNHSSTKATIRCSEYRRLGKFGFTWEIDQIFEGKSLENVLLWCISS